MGKIVLIMRFSHPEKQYLNLIKKIIKKAPLENRRNGKVYNLIGETMRFSLAKQTLPLLTTKRVGWNVCLKELFWFMHGKTDNSLLVQDNINIWSGNASREFLDSQGLFSLDENDLGPIYGHQWRHFNAPYINCFTNYTGKGIDQLQNIIDALKDKKQRTSRRLILSAWNPLQITEMALPPCHVLAQFHVTNDVDLTCSLYQRSGDVGLGIPYNIASYSFLTHLLAHHCDLRPKEFIHFIGNAHIYDNHVEALKKQIIRKPKNFPKVKILNKYENINDYRFEDFQVSGYIPHPLIKMKMRP